MNTRLPYLVLIPLFFTSCSEKQDEPATPEKEMDTQHVASREAKSEEENTGKEGSSLAEEMQNEVSEESDTSESPVKYPVATAVPGPPGFVYSPYNNQIIDVREIPSGMLVADPTYPMAEKKYFRVP